MTLHRAFKECIDKRIINYFYGGLSIAETSKKMKEDICDMDGNIKTLSDVRGYVSHVIYQYQLTNY